MFKSTGTAAAGADRRCAAWPPLSLRVDFCLASAGLVAEAAGRMVERGRNK